MSIEVKPSEIPTNGIQYYWCVNCGHNGKFDFVRMTRSACQKCKYDAITPYDLEEIMEDDHLRFRFQEVLKSENTPIVGS